MPGSSQHLVLVLGMHRSGTSVVAKALTTMGVALGPRAEWSAPDNPRGFWEDLDALALNERILAVLGSHWANPAPIEGVQDFQPAGPHALLTNRLTTYPLFGLKEPRMCRLLPVWRRAIDKLGCKVSVVHVFRHPAAVAASLAKRDRIPLRQGYALWMEYVSRQLADADRAWPAAMVDYDAMMSKPAAEVQRIGIKLGLHVNPGALRAFARDFVDRGLRHEANDGELPAPVEAVWNLVMLMGVTQ